MPFIAGLGIPRSLARDHDLMLMAHPTFSGGHFVSRREGIDHGLLFGMLLRIVGADVAVFPNVGGRFQFTRDDCAGIAARLRAPLGRLLPAWPCPASGMSFKQLPGMCADYGPDAALLIGGALIGHGEDLEASTRTHLDTIRAASQERLEAPGPPRELPFDAQAPRVLAHRLARSGPARGAVGAMPPQPRGPCTRRPTAPDQENSFNWLSSFLACLPGIRERRLSRSRSSMSAR